MDERNEDGKVNMPLNEFDFGVFTTCLASCFSGKVDETIRIMDPRILQYILAKRVSPS